MREALLSLLERWLAPLRRSLERLRFGNLAPRLLRSDTQPPGASSFQLPPGRYDAGLYVLVVHAQTPLRRVLGRIVASLETGEGELAFGLTTKRERSVFRVVRFPTPVRHLRFELDVDVEPSALSLLRLHPIPRWFARRRMFRRIGLEHPSLAGRERRRTADALSRFAQSLSLSEDDALFHLYEQTFSSRRHENDYASWMALVEAPADAELPTWPRELAGPVFSVLVPVHETPLPWLEDCVGSVLGQSYPHWQLCLVDDGSQDPRLLALLRELPARDARVSVRRRESNGHICRASNDALELATGDFVALLDHDDRLAPHALLRMALALRDAPDACVLYGDEDKLDEAGRRTAPHFKPEFDPERLLAQNYVGHLVALGTQRVRALGGFRPGYEGSQDHDLLLRATEGLGPRHVVHVPHVLYHWRQSEASTALRPQAKSYAAEAGLRAVQDALDRRGLRARAEHAPLVPHGYRVRYELPEEPPLVSLIVPTRDKADLLRVCLGSILEKTTYPRYEVLVVDNGSVEPESFALFEELRRDERVRVLRDDGPFNFSRLNNDAARRARGEVLGLINNDVEALDGDWLSEMVSHALRPELGCVGAKLLYPNGTIQHAGVVTGIGGVAGHSHKYLPEASLGYFGRLALQHTVSAVTAACLVVRREIFDEVGGLDERLAVAFNDVDFCLKVREAGYRNLYTPYAVLRHHESATRGQEVTDAQLDRFAGEALAMKERWGYTLRRDPYYSPHLSLEHEDFSIGIRV